MAEETNNMEIWERVGTTDVNHTKEVSFGRKFTAIDAHSQVMEATREFGPIGKGWGYTNEYGEIHLNDGQVVVWCDVTLWWGEHGQWEGMKTPPSMHKFGPVRGSAMLVKGKKIDNDAYKKASTDGLTKALSHLGFNADVFLGKFDDNKYVTELKEAKDNELSAKEQAYQQDRAKFIKKIQECKTPESMDAVLKNHELWMAGLPVATATEMRTWVTKQKIKLSEVDEDGSE